MKGLVVDHIGIAVMDVDRYINIYGALGYHPFHRETVRDQESYITLLRGGKKDVMVELVSPMDGHGPLVNHLERHGEGHLHHIAWRVDDIGDVVGYGFNVVNRPRGGFAGTRVVFVHPRDTGGVLWEFVEYQRVNRLVRYIRNHVSDRGEGYNF